MPAKSKAQLRFMAAVASGSIKKKGLSKAQASEWVHATGSAKGLPNRVTKKGNRNKKRRTH
jgi:hypothetical protein